MKKKYCKCGLSRAYGSDKEGWTCLDCNLPKKKVEQEPTMSGHRCPYFDCNKGACAGQPKQEPTCICNPQIVSIYGEHNSKCPMSQPKTESRECMCFCHSLKDGEMKRMFKRCLCECSSAIGVSSNQASESNQCHTMSPKQDTWEDELLEIWKSEIGKKTQGLIIAHTKELIEGQLQNQRQEIREKIRDLIKFDLFPSPQDKHGNDYKNMTLDRLLDILDL